jgi:60 kDa SS-A/Ro ribonucleoprotein
MRLNVARTNPNRTYEGAPAIPPRNALAELRRAVASCLLWEDQFYEDGVAIGDRIAALVAQADPTDVAALAVEARTQMKLRHAPLWLLAGLAKAGNGASANTYAETIQRADEMGELIAMHWKDGKRPLPAAMKRGIAKAFGKFDAYRLGKYNRKVTVTLKDVLRLVHPKPANDDQAALWKKIVDGTLEAPDTWEVALSGGANKKETFERLIREGQLGYLALLRNLRNMTEAGCDAALVRDAILARKGAHNVLPFRFIAAARAAPQFEPALDEALVSQIEGLPVLPGTTAILVDVSGSMDTRLSGKSDLDRIDAAAALASIIPGNVRVFTFSHQVVEVPPRRGMAGVDVIKRSQPHGGTYLGAAVRAINDQVSYDRLIVVTDEQSADPVGSPKGRGYMINVAAYRNGVGYGDWTRIEGFSENVLRFIAEREANVAG